METAFVCVDVVRERYDVLAVTVCILERYLDRITFLFCFVIEDCRVDRFFVFIEVVYEFFDAAFEAEVVFSLRADSLVCEVDGEAFVEEGHLAEAPLERFVVVYCLVEDLRIRPELCSRSRLASLVLAYYLELC